MTPQPAEATLVRIADIPIISTGIPGNDLLLVTYPEKAADLRDALAVLAAREAWAREALDRAATRVLGLKADMGLLAEH